jgi:hypothetical protein
MVALAIFVTFAIVAFAIVAVIWLGGAFVREWHEHRRPGKSWWGWPEAEHGTPSPDPDWREERRKQQEADRRERAEKQKKLIQESSRIAPEILERNSTLVDQFLFCRTKGFDP